MQWIIDTLSADLLIINIKTPYPLITMSWMDSKRRWSLESRQQAAVEHFVDMMDRHVYQTNVSNRISIILTWILDIKFGDQICQAWQLLIKGWIITPRHIFRMMDLIKSSRLKMACCVCRSDSSQNVLHWLISIVSTYHCGEVSDASTILIVVRDLIVYMHTHLCFLSIARELVIGYVYNASDYESKVEWSIATKKMWMSLS